MNSLNSSSALKVVVICSYNLHLAVDFSLSLPAGSRVFSVSCSRISTLKSSSALFHGRRPASFPSAGYIFQPDCLVPRRTPGSALAGAQRVSVWSRDNSRKNLMLLRLYLRSSERYQLELILKSGEHSSSRCVSRSVCHNLHSTSLHLYSSLARTPGIVKLRSECASDHAASIHRRQRERLVRLGTIFDIGSVELRKEYGILLQKNYGKLCLFYP